MKCNNCGANYQGTERVCPKCGVLLQPFSELYPKPADEIRYTSTGKVIAGLSVVIAVLSVITVCVIAVAPFISTLFSGHKEIDLEQEELQHVSELVETGSSANHNDLIEARQMLQDFSGTTESSTLYADTIMALLRPKLQEAFDAWMKAAKAQFEIADNVEGALKYYNCADSILPGQSRLKEELHAMSLKSGLKGAELLLTGLTTSNTSMTFHYKYFGSYDTSLRLTIEREDATDAAKVTLPLTSGFAGEQSTTISNPYLTNYYGPVNVYEGEELLYQISITPNDNIAE